MNQDANDILDDLQNIVDGCNTSGMLEIETLIYFIEEKRQELKGLKND